MGESDISYVPTDEGRLHLAGLKGLLNGELVGYGLSERMTKKPVMQSLFRGVCSKRQAKALIPHSDRGNQYRLDFSRHWCYFFRCWTFQGERAMNECPMHHPHPTTAGRPFPLRRR